MRLIQRKHWVKVILVQELGESREDELGTHTRIGENASISSEDPFDLHPIISKLNHVLHQKKSDSAFQHSSKPSGAESEENLRMPGKQSAKSIIEVEEGVEGIRRKLKAGRKTKWMTQAQVNGRAGLDGGTNPSDLEIRSCNSQILSKNPAELVAELW